MPSLENLYWPHRGGTLEALLDKQPEIVQLAPPDADEIIVRVEAVSICSSDIKIVKMGLSHPLFAGRDGAIDTVLGHEACLRVHAVGDAQAGRFHEGQRLGLQPALVVDGVRSIIGMGRPGAFTQFLRLGPEVLDGYVFDVPEHVPAAAIALLEPYGCVEKSWRQNARCDLLPGGRALIVSAGGDFQLDTIPDWKEITVVGEPPAFLRTRTTKRVETIGELQGSFDDILALGDLPASDLSRLCELMAEGGLLLQGRKGSSPGPVRIDPARIHYHRLSLLGTSSRNLDEAFRPAARRFDVRPQGVALIHGAGGAMGRIHVHRLLQLTSGPKTIIATSRSGQRLNDIERDFGPLAKAHGRRLVVTSVDALPSVIETEAPGGLDDAVVVVPSASAIEDVVGYMAPDGLLSVFAGFPYGQTVDIDLAAVALTGMRLTGSTGCSVDDMRDVLARVESGDLDLSPNIAAVAGLNDLPRSLQAVSDGDVSGKIVIYPQQPALPLTAVGNWGSADEVGLTGAERR